jgi:hypothetical protein
MKVVEKFAHRFTFKIFNNTSTDHPRVVGLYTENQMAPQTVFTNLPLQFGTNWNK